MKYEIEQIERAELNHDWNYGFIKIKFYGTDGESKFLNINKEQLNKIKDILRESEKEGLKENGN